MLILVFLRLFGIPQLFYAISRIPIHWYDLAHKPMNDILACDSNDISSLEFPTTLPHKIHCVNHRIEFNLLTFFIDKQIAAIISSPAAPIFLAEIDLDLRVTSKTKYICIPPKEFCKNGFSSRDRIN